MKRLPFAPIILSSAALCSAGTITFQDAAGPGYSFTAAGHITYDEEAIGSTFSSVVGTTVLAPGATFINQTLPFSFEQVDASSTRNAQMFWLILENNGGGATLYAQAAPAGPSRPLTLRLRSFTTQLESATEGATAELTADITPTGVPEPRYGWLIGLGLGIAGLFRRRRT